MSVSCTGQQWFPAGNFVTDCQSNFCNLRNCDRFSGSVQIWVIIFKKNKNDTDFMQFYKVPESKRKNFNFLDVVNFHLYLCSKYFFESQPLFFPALPLPVSCPSLEIGHYMGDIYCGNWQILPIMDFPQSQLTKLCIYCFPLWQTAYDRHFHNSEILF